MLQLLLCRVIDSMPDGPNIVVTPFTRELGTAIRIAGVGFRVAASVVGGGQLAEMRWRLPQLTRWTRRARLRTLVEDADLLGTLDEGDCVVADVPEQAFNAFCQTQLADVRQESLSLHYAADLTKLAFYFSGYDMLDKRVLRTVGLPWDLVDECCPSRGD